MARAHWVLIANSHTGDMAVTGPFDSADEATDYGKANYSEDTWYWNAKVLQFPMTRGQ